MIPHRVTITCLLILFSILNESDAIISPKGILNKCCPNGKRFQFTLQNEDVLECVPIGPETNTTDWWWWFPKHVTNLSNSDTNTTSNINGTQEIAALEKQQIYYGTKPDCASHSHDILYHIAKARREFNFVVDDDQIKLEVLKGASLHDKAGHSELFPSSDYCVDAGPKEFNMFVVYVCPCTTIRCVRKCCGEDEVYDDREGKCTHASSKVIGDIFNWLPTIRKDMKGELEYYRLVNKQPVCPHSVTVTNTNYSKPNFYLLQDKSIQVVETGAIFPPYELCVDFTTSKTEMVYFCVTPELATVVLYYLYGVIFTIGTAALLVTVSLAAILPEMRRNIYNKMALTHNLMLLIGYVTTGVSQMIGATLPIEACKYLSFIIQFSILVAVFTLNVMCVDISLVFSEMRPYHGTVVQKDRKKFIIYSLYAFGSTSLISLITVIIEFSPGVSPSMKPNFGEDVLCFFNGRAATWLLFYGPMVVLYSINLALFFFTASKIFAVKRDTAILNTAESATSAKNKQKMVLYINLFIMMSLDITWVVEVISFTYSSSWPSYLWRVCDIIFLLRGVFIFLIFCCRRSVFTLVRDKVRRCRATEGETKNNTKDSSTTTSVVDRVSEHCDDIARTKV